MGKAVHIAGERLPAFSYFESREKKEKPRIVLQFVLRTLTNHILSAKIFHCLKCEMPSSVSLGPNLGGLEYSQIEPGNSRGSSLGSADSSLESNTPVQSNGISDRVEEELSQLWDSGQEWILIFDNLLKHPGGKVSKGCKCDICQRSKPTDDTISKFFFMEMTPIFHKNFDREGNKKF